jgi:hypothetical protein
METIIVQLQSTDIKTKLSAIDCLCDKLNKGKGLTDLSNDTRVRLYSACVSLLKDANPKIVNSGFDIVQIFIDDTISFQPLVNLTFDILLVKFGKCLLM